MGNSRSRWWGENDLMVGPVGVHLGDTDEYSLSTVGQGPINIRNRISNVSWTNNMTNSRGPLNDVTQDSFVNNKRKH